MNYKIFYAWLQPFFGEHISCNLIRYHYCNVNYLAQLNITTSIKMTHQSHLRSTSAMLLIGGASVKLSHLKKISQFIFRSNSIHPWISQFEIWISFPLSSSYRSLSLRNTETEAGNKIWSWVSNLALSSSFGSNCIYDISEA